MNLYLTHELLLGSALGERRLLDYFGCTQHFSVLIYNFIALSKPSLAEELASHVLLNLNFSIVLNDLFFYEDLLDWFH